jgi:GDP-4-dehydro-6-deoxy-D-mannose reductase
LSNQVLVTGASGFAGGFLVDLLLAQGKQVVGTTREEIPPDFPADHVPLLPCDLGEPEGIREIYHLAAQASVAHSWEEPAETFRVNAMGTINLLEACRSHGLQTRILLVSSATVYGPPPKDGSLTEDTPLQPTDPYGVSKAAADQAAVFYHKAYDMDILRARAFNHIGPGAATQHAIGNFARQIAECELAGGGELRVGNLSARRNFTDVRDVVRAYALLVERGESGEAYNVCGNTVVSMEEILDRLIALSPCELQKVQEPERMRPFDSPLVDGGNAKLIAATGWKPAISLEQSLEDILSHWRDRVRENPQTPA